MPALTTTVPLIRSPLLTQFPGIDLGMSTAQGAARTAPFGFNLGFHLGEDDDSVTANLDRFLAAFQLTGDRLASMRQIHGTTITEINEPGVYADTDALVTRTPGLALTVRTADCVPVMLYAPGDRAIAAVHAGWRGTAAHIASQAVAFLQERYGVEPEEILAWIGPAAGPERYEVGDDIAAQFDGRAVVRDDGQKPRLDLKRANALDLKAAGLNPRNIDISPWCTISNPAIFHSYRRDGEESGRMLALIVLKEEA